LRFKKEDELIPFLGIAGDSDAGNGADKREIDRGSDKLRQASLDRSVVVDTDKLAAEPVVRKPAGFFHGKRLAVGPVGGGLCE